MLHLIPLTLEQLWDFYFFFCHHRCFEGSHFCVCVSAAPRLCTCSVCHVVVDSCHIFSSKHAHTLQIPADVTMAQSMRCGIANSKTSWNCMKSLEEKELDCSWVCMQMCICACLCAGQSVRMREHDCASAVFLCVHIYAHALVCTCPCAWARQVNGRLGVSLCGILK